MSNLQQTIDVDEYFAVAVLTVGGFYPESSRLERGRVVFSFDNLDGRVSDLLQKHLTGTFCPPSRDLCSAIQQIKSQIMAARRGLDC